MLILSLLFVCHFVADFTHLSTDKMLEGKKEGNIHEIAFHASMHALLHYLVVLVFTWDVAMAFAVYGFQGFAHTVIDYGKWYVSSKRESFRDISKRSFWYIFGMDQLLHALTILFIYFYIIN